jgi:O-antigen/teichoic acid export membrane protein
MLIVKMGDEKLYMKQLKSASHRIILNTGILYARMGITIFISLYTTRLILNALGVGDFGIFSIVGGMIGMLSFLSTAMASTTQRFMSYFEGSGDKEKLKHIFNVSIILHFFIALMMGIILLIAGYFFFNGILNIPADRMSAARIVYYFMILSVLFTVITAPYDAVLNAHENMMYYAIVGIVESILKLAVAFIVVYTLSDKLIVYGAFMAGISLLVMIIMRMYCHKKYEECKFLPKIYYDKSLMKEMTQFTGWNFIGNMAVLVGNHGNVILINHFFGIVVSAAIGIAIQVQGQLMSLSNNMIKALNPVIVKKEGEGNRTSMLHFSLIGCKYSFLLMAFLSIPFIIETPVILKLWLKQVPEWTTLFVRLILIWTLLEQFTRAIEIAMSAQGNIKGLKISCFILCLLPLPILYILFTLHFPPYWMYIISIVSMVFGLTGFKLYLCQKHCNLKISELFVKVVYPCIIVFTFVVGIGFLPSLFLEEGLVRLLFCFILSTIALICTSILFALSTEERQFFIRIINKLKMNGHK